MGKRAAIGESAASAVHSQDDVRPVRKYDFVKGKINGIPFHGWLGRVTARPGDVIELVAIDKNDHYEVYALAIPELRVVSVIPECDSGSKSRGIFELKTAFYLWLALLVLTSFSLMFLDDVNIKDAAYFILMCSAVFAIVLSLVGLGAYISWLVKPRPSALLAQNIFSALEISNPKDVDLNKYTEEIIKRNNLNKENGRIMPDKCCSSDYYFYY